MGGETGALGEPSPPTVPRAGEASLSPGPSAGSEGKMAGVSTELVVLSGGRLGPFCHLDPSGQAGGLVGGNVSFRQGKWGQPSSSVPGHSPVLLLSGPPGLPVPRPQCPLRPPCPTPWSLPGSELATPGWPPWPSLAPGRAQRPSLALPAAPRLTILPGPAALRRGRSPSGCS